MRALLSLAILLLAACGPGVVDQVDGGAPDLAQQVADGGSGDLGSPSPDLAEEYPGGGRRGTNG